MADDSWKGKNEVSVTRKGESCVGEKESEWSMNDGLEVFGRDEVYTKEMFFRQTCIHGARLRYSILFPVDQEVRLIIAVLFWPYFLSVFNWRDHIQLSFEPTTCYAPLQTLQIQPSP